MAANYSIAWISPKAIEKKMENGNLKVAAKKAWRSLSICIFQLSNFYFFQTSVADAGFCRLIPFAGVHLVLLLFAFLVDDI